MIVTADCLDFLPTLEAESIDACVTDPPYELGFMGKHWDRSGIAANVEMWELVWRALRPGAHLLAFGGTRTFHRTVCAIEDAGFEIRDSIAWLYGSGFPKSLDVSKALDKRAGAEREKVGSYTKSVSSMGSGEGNFSDDNYQWKDTITLTAPATPEAQQWEGWGTALKPAMELICVARKPLSEKTVAANVLRHGTGAINVDGCRIEGPAAGEKRQTLNVGGGVFGGSQVRPYVAAAIAEGKPFREDYSAHPSGRWPANVCLDEEAAELLDAAVGTTPSGGRPQDRKRDPSAVSLLGQYRPPYEPYADTMNGGHGPSRFYYCAKASRREREAGLRDGGVGALRDGGRSISVSNHHPTVKPLSLMRWLCRLVTPPGGLILEPFAGSGSTCIAAGLEGFRFLGCEREEEYAQIARARLAHWLKQPALLTA